MFAASTHRCLQAVWRRCAVAAWLLAAPAPGEAKAPAAAPALPAAPQQDDRLAAWLPQLRSAALLRHVQQLSQYFDRGSTHPSGRAAATYLHRNFAKLAGRRDDVEVCDVDHGLAQPSVILRLCGHGPHAAERVIIGAHLDSVNQQVGDGGAAPGADDDASGVAALWEVARVLLEADYRPRRTLELMAYAGEEMGLLGSRQIAEAYAEQGISVVGVMQLDMTMYPGDPDGALYLVRDGVDDALSDYVAQLGRHYLHVEMRPTRCGYPCSDHASWTRAGYRSAFPFEADFWSANPAIHTPFDTWEAGLDAEHGLQFAKLALAFAVELCEP